MSIQTNTEAGNVAGQSSTILGSASSDAVLAAIASATGSVTASGSGSVLNTSKLSGSGTKVTSTGVSTGASGSSGSGTSSMSHSGSTSDSNILSVVNGSSDAATILPVSGTTTAPTTTNTGPALASAFPIDQKSLTAQWTSLSATCKDTMQQFANGKHEFSKCSGISQLYSDLISNAALVGRNLTSAQRITDTSAQDPSTSLIPMVKDWLEKSACKVDGCDSATVNTALKMVSETCQGDTDNRNWLATAVYGAILVSIVMKVLRGYADEIAASEL